MDNENPFAALLQSSAAKPEEEPKTGPPSSDVLEDVFGFTLIEKNAVERHLVFLRDVAEVFPKGQLDVEILEHALFERLLLKDENKVGAVLQYLFDCYGKSEVLDQRTRSAVKAIIIRNVVTALQQPDLYAEQNVYQQLFDLLLTDFCEKQQFFEDLYEACVNDEGKLFVFFLRIILYF